jgi:uroporphyrin-III C-methyltransferase
LNPTCLVPGISSSIAVPASQGISLTKEAFQKVLGDYGNHFGKKMSTDALAAQSTATVVILMGMSKLDQISFEKSRKARPPVAIIQNGTTAAEKVRIALNTIQSVVAAKV